MEEERKHGCVVIIDGDQYHLGEHVHEDTTLTLLATLSDDPATLDEMAGLWPRYRTPVVPEFLDCLTLQRVDRQTAAAALRQDDQWLAIDLRAKRACTGTGFFEVGRNQAYNMCCDDQSQERSPLSIHLPPWWELHELVDADRWADPRSTPLAVPSANREVLYGDAMLRFFAGRIADIVLSDDWTGSGAAVESSDARGYNPERYRFTKAIHREWLMTPRSDLDGQTPRSNLHGGRRWIERVTHAQQLRCEDGGTIVAIPDDLQSYATAPMALEEIVVYFDLCRELIDAGWQYCLGAESTESLRQLSTDQLAAELLDHLRETREQWLHEPFEDDAPPEFVIECSRRRVPRAPGVAIVGMERQQDPDHPEDCDCPMCVMAAEGFFGPGFIHMDGHHLELDDDFAFSLCETFEEWEDEQAEFHSLSDSIEQEMHRDGNPVDCPAEFQSVWSGSVSDEPLPGDVNGCAKLAFLLSEIVDELRQADAPQATIEMINEHFCKFRTSGPNHNVAAGKTLNDGLESLCPDYPSLVARIADFQSRVDECLRMPIVGDDPEPMF